MAKLKVLKGGEEFALMLSNLGAALGKDIPQKVVYAGAKVAADALYDEIKGLPEEDERSSTLRGVIPAEKTDLIKGMGVTPIKTEDGITNAKTGFHDYGHPTKKYPGGIPIPMLARSINNGSQYRVPNRFADRAGRRAAAPAQKAMDETARAEFKKITK